MYSSKIKIDLGDQTDCFFGKHRSGWSFAVSALCGSNDPDGIYLDTFVERTHVWGQKADIENKAYIPKKEWVGIIHVPPMVPCWFNRDITNKSIFALPSWKEIYELCRGIFTLSGYHKIYLEKLLDVPIDLLLHPMEIPEKKWSIDSFISNPLKKIVQVGWWLRNLHAIFELPSSSNFKKIFLKPRKGAWFNKLMEEEKIERIRLGKFKHDMYESADIISFLPNNEYDELLSKNIVFVYLYDASANNAVIECIARNTPILINKIPPVVEYLGEDYPFYFCSYEEAVEKANNFEIVYNTHEYLKVLPIKKQLTTDYFRSNILNSSLLRSDNNYSKNRNKKSLPYSIVSQDYIPHNIYIVTPCLNAIDTIDQTILSVITQAGNFFIHYHIQDGGSTDGTLEKLIKWKKLLQNDHFPHYRKNLIFTYESVSDQGMYDAIAKSFASMSISSDSFMAWINADDILMPGSLSLVQHVGTQFRPEHISWLTGAVLILKDDKPVTQEARKYSGEIIKKGCCDGKHWYYFQQEGTFFRNWLWNKVEAEKVIKKFKYAGDWNLWRLFARYACPVTVPWPLGAFRVYDGQLSQIYKNQYEKEIEKCISLSQRSKAFKELVEQKNITQWVLKTSYPNGDFELIEETANGQADYFYHKNYGCWPKRRLNKILDKKEKVVCETIDLKSKSKSYDKQKPEIYDPEINHAIDVNHLNEPRTFFVVTTCLNAARTIDDTVHSIISQEGSFFIRYHVQDRGSNDFTIERLQYWEAILADTNPYVQCQGVIFTWSSIANQGLYDAVVMSFDHEMNITSDDFMVWIHSGDTFFSDTLSIISRISAKYPDIQWIGDSPHDVYPKDIMINRQFNPISTSVIREGLCDGQDYHWRQLQQERMFFKKSLWFRSKHVLRGFKFAGDWALWREFAHHAEYCQYDKPLGVFSNQNKKLQIKSNDDYDAEIEKVLPTKQRDEAMMRLHSQRHKLHASIVRIGKKDRKIKLNKEFKDVQKKLEYFVKKIRKN